MIVASMVPMSVIIIVLLAGLPTTLATALCKARTANTAFVVSYDFCLKGALRDSSILRNARGFSQCCGGVFTPDHNQVSRAHHLFGSKTPKMKIMDAFHVATLLEPCFQLGHTDVRWRSDHQGMEGLHSGPPRGEKNEDAKQDGASWICIVPSADVVGRLP